MNIIDKETGREFEVLGKPTTFPIADVATHVIGTDCKIREAGSGTYLCYLRLIRKRHMFGGVVFEETGERQVPHADQWWLGGMNTLYPGYGGTHEVQTILNYVEKP